MIWTEWNGKVLALQRLRALAAFAVVYFHFAHYWFPGRVPEFRGGPYGVDLFFVISGYVVSQTFLKTLGQPLSIPRFYLRRILRIFPLALLCLGLYLMLALLVPNRFSSSNPAITLEAIKQVLTFRYNYYLIYHPESDVLGLFWTLMIEEHFYLLLPFLLIALKSRKARLLACVGGIAVLDWLVKPWMIRGLSPELASRYLLFASECRFDELFLGVAIFLFRDEFKPRAPAPAFVFCASWIALLGLFLFSESMNPFWSQLFCGLLVYLASFDPKVIFSIPFCNPMLEYLGERSYGIYLLQGLTLRIWLKLFYAQSPPPILVIVLIYFGSLILVAAGSYQLVERRFILWGRTLSQKLALSNMLTK